MSPNLDTLMRSLESPVRPPDQTDPQAMVPEVDTLFGDSPSYLAIKREKPEHRLILWHRLRGHSVKEIAVLMRRSSPSIYAVCQQPWFEQAFCRLSSEIGKDVVETFLEGEVVPTLQALVRLRDSAESDAVKKSACDSILDRIRGKPTQRVETKVSGGMDVAVYDATKLMEEQERNAKILKDRGIGTN